MSTISDDNAVEATNFLDKSPECIVEHDGPTWSDTLPQIFASCIAYGIVIQAGVNMAYSTVLIGGLQSNENNYTIDESQVSWIVSVVTLFTPLGSLVAGPLMDKFGRKKICMTTCLIIILSWTIITISSSLSSLTLIYMARITAGLAGGLSTTSLVYVMEISHPHVRGMLLCFNSISVSLGILLTCFFALFLNWRDIAIVFIALNVIIFLGLFLIPESPHWLVYFDKADTTTRIARAENNLRWLNPNLKIYEQECLRIQETNTARCRVNDNKSSDDIFNVQVWKLIITPKIYRPFFILFAILFIQQLSGCYVVIFYAISVFQNVGGKFGVHLNEYGALVLLGIIRFVMSIFTAILSRSIGRRILCIISGIGMGISMLFITLYLHITSLMNADSVNDEYNWILLIFVLSYVGMSSLGFLVIPWTLIGELLPISFRGVGGGLMISIAYTIMFGVVKTYPYAINHLGAKHVFAFFAVASLIGSILIHFILPETLGKSFSEIEQYFVKKYNKNNDTICKI